MAKKKMIHRHKGIELRDGKFVDTIDERDVTVMVISGRYAMVRLPGCTPYVAEVSELHEKAPE